MLGSSSPEAAEIRAYIDDLLAGALAAGWDSYQVVNWHKCCRGIWDIVTDSRIIDVVSDLLGDTVILRHSHLFAKLPGDAPVALEMRAGQISLHSDWILHGSEPNRSNRRRCGLAMRYLSADVRAYDGWNTNSTWCRGTDAGGHWANHPRPDGEDIPTPESGAADDPVTEASLSPHRQQ